MLKYVPDTKSTGVIPLGLCMSLMMLKDGAEGETAKEISKALGLDGLNTHKLAKQLQSILQESASVDFTTVSHIFTQCEETN